MASHLKNLVRGIEESIMEKEKMDDYEAMAEAMEKEKTNVTTRLDSMQIAYLDMLAEKCNVSRSAMLKELSTSALMDVIEEMGVKQEFFERLTDQIKKGAENV